MIKVVDYDSITKVPLEWEKIIGDNIYLSIQFLSFMEQIDKCQQHYYMIYNDDKLDTIFMTYKRDNYNLGMFTKINLVQKITMIYVPLSVTRPGIVYGKHFDKALDIIKKIKGPKMIFNIEDLNIKGWAKGLTCPKCIFYNKFSSFEEYLQKLRSNYRHRYKKVFERSKDLKLEYLVDNKDFTEEMYDCYLQVYNKSRVKIEKLDINFFRGSFFKIFVLKKEDEVVGFGQMLENGKELIFEFVGVNYKYNNEYDVYHRILLEIVKYGIENGFETIDFGQTADESKLKLGSKYTELYVYLHHSNPINNFINRKMASFLEYKPIKTEFRIFKEE